MSNSGIKISDLTKTTVIPESGELAIAVGGNISQTFGATLTALRSALLFEDAFDTVANGIKGTVNGDIFFVYSDTSKSTVLGYTNISGSSAVALNDDSGNQVRYGTYISIRDGGGSGDSSNYIDWVYNNGAAKGGETSIVISTPCLDVKAAWVGGSRQFKSINFEFNVGTQTVTLADALEGGELVVFEILPTFGTNTVDPDIKNYVNVSWVYNDGAAVGGETVITPPYTFETVPAVYLNGSRQALGFQYTVDSGTTITLTSPLKKGDFLQVILGGESTEIVPGSDPFKGSFVSLYQYLSSDQILNAQKGVFSEDLSDVIEGAAKNASLLNKSLFIPAGDYFIARTINFYSSLIGEGKGKTIIHVASGSGGLMSQGYLALSTNPEVCLLRDFTITGIENNFFQLDKTNYPDTFYNSTTAGTEGLIRAEYYRVCYVENVEVNWSRGFSVTVTLNERTIVRNCEINYGMRDGIRAGGGKEILITGNVIKHCGDNAISAGDFYRDNKLPFDEITARSCIVTNNTCVDTGGFGLLGATTTIVSDNVLTRSKTLGMIISWGAGLEGANDTVDLVIENNIITDNILASAVVAAGGSNIASQGTDDRWCACIILQPYPPVSVTGSVPPGNYDYSLKKFVLPETYYLTSAGNTDKTAPMLGIKGLRIKGNKFTRSLPDVLKYSDWNLGLAFTPTGWVDPVCSLMRTGYGIVTRTNTASTSTSLVGAEISDNEFYGFYSAIDLSNVSFLHDIRINGNRFERLNSRGLRLSGGNWSNATKLGYPQGYIEIKNNSFDNDPYLENSAHNSDGTWTDTDASIAIDRYYTTGTIISGNTFRNVSSGIGDLNSFLSNIGTENTHGTGVIFDNTYICQPADNYDSTVAGSLNNKGIRLVPKIILDHLIVEDSDPQSATYLKTLYSTGSKSAYNCPTAGWWPLGLFIQNTSNTISSETITISSTEKLKHTYLVTGWYRANSGSGNVLGTDWIVGKNTISWGS